MAARVGHLAAAGSDGEAVCLLRVDGLHVNVRMEASPCFLVLIGATVDEHKELVAVQDLIRESEQTLKDLILNCPCLGLAVGPNLATGTGH
ncbi:MAG: hypothetical protein KC592_17950 [Nitrospira sp.]|nr:hypothetical protein [Nitrospira sp.]